MDKTKLSETDICDKFITPALTHSGWDTVEQIFREYVVRGQKGQPRQTPSNSASSPASNNSAASAPNCASGSPRPTAHKANADALVAEIG